MTCIILPVVNNYSTEVVKKTECFSSICASRRWLQQKSIMLGYFSNCTVGEFQVMVGFRPLCLTYRPIVCLVMMVVARD